MIGAIKPFRVVTSFIVMMGFGLIGAWLAVETLPVDTVAAQDGPSTPPLTEGSTCADCHIDVASHWQGSVHAMAYADPTFQSAWASQGEPADCLSCHTTGFNPRTGTFQQEGVACEACHGQTPATHPEEPIPSNPGAEVCADCHTSTFSEWEMSGHAAQDIACVACHEPHPQQLAAADPNTLCLDCHSDDSYSEPESAYIHDTHAESQECVDCHWFHSEEDVDGIHIVSGNLLPSGHDNAVTTAACIDCHAEDMENDLIADADFTLAQQLEVEELESEIESTLTQGENTASLRAAQGLVVGIIIGGALMLLLNWRSAPPPTSTSSNDNTEEDNDE